MKADRTYIQEALSLDLATGKLFWKVRPSHHFVSASVAKCVNSRLAGKEAFTAMNGNGYRQGEILERKYLAHQVVWLLANGSWPPEGMVVDHINGDGLDNRPENLRIASPSQNGANKGSLAGATSRFMGVCRIKGTSRWQAHVRSQGKVVWSGAFPTEAEAAQAYNRAAVQIHGEFARLNDVHALECSTTT